ncbi:WD40-repeat-containing domain protein [Kockovaella imperatae]|uniref:WD40-repeat-containing domain protein n=1 Tax=Kockovaella imperatae TaxID=4999 RepID=A0A1Y1URN4_9TREE|nr:WD40-repeat-containing domain protein [Kockovaella imperatae]ORX40723.1 WD40-repeat-containing domain protein [Kockovaella imperatae]
MPRHLLQPLPRAVSGHRDNFQRIHQYQDGSIWDRLDRCQVLGNSHTGHRGCVNALSWSNDGSTLLSGSDDGRICIWGADSSSMSESPHPLRLNDTIATGHTGNIFSAKYLPNTSSPIIVSCAGDRTVKVFEVERLGRSEVGIGMAARDELWGVRGPGVRILRCHTDRTKRIATENSPFLFLTVSEDGTVRQHDLRRPHVCRSDCPDPLFRAPRGIDLYSLSVSTVTPNMFAVAGRTHCAYLCDRRMLERQTPSWGPNIQSSEQVHCVRRLGMTDEQWANGRPSGRILSSEKHITCVKMSPEHADEVICAFASHSVGIFSTYDSPGPSNMRQRSASPITAPPVPTPVSRRQYTIDDFLRDSPDLARSKRRQSVLSSVAPDPTPPQRQRSEGDNEDMLESLGSSSHPMAVQDIREEPPGTNADAQLHSPRPATYDQPQRIATALDDTVFDAELDDENQELLNLHEMDEDEIMEEEEEEEEDLILDEDDDDEYDDYEEDEDVDDDDDDDEDDIDALDFMEPPARATVFDSVDMITPRSNFRGAKNMDTVKDCNFLGSRSEKVCCGSDDGNFFVWDKATGRLDGIWEGDGSIVNVIEQHPTLPLIAVSGIDSTVKMFSPLPHKPDPSFSRLHLRDSIIKANLEERPLFSRGGFASVSLFEFLAQRGMRPTVHTAGENDGRDEDGSTQQCPTQ